MTQRINSFFSSSQELLQLSGKVRQLRAFQLHYAQIAPPSLLRASSVSHIENGTLTLTANNSAIASKLRQMLPELLKHLQLQGCEVTGIQVRVQVTIPPNKVTAPPSMISVSGKHQLNELAKSLGESPLKTALQRLAANNTKKSTE